MNRKKPKLSYASIKSSAKHNSLGLLGSYKDTSSEESEEETPAQKDERSVISLVEDFVKEVNGMDTKPKSSKSQKAAKKETTPQVAVAAPAEEPNWGPWKKCIDENTKHPYYWNTETNQVTWSIPPELMVTATPIKKTSEPEHKEKSVRKETSIETESSEPISKKQKLSKVIGRLPNTDVVVGGRSVFATARKVDDVDKVAPSTTLAATLDKKYQQKKDESLLLSKPKSKSSSSSESSESRYESDKRSKWRSSDDKVSSSSTHQSSSKSLDRKKSREKIDFPPTKILSNSLHDEIMNNSHKKLSSSKSLSSSYTTASVGAVIEGSRVAAEGSSDSSSKRSSRSPENNQLKETIKLTSKMLLEKLKYLEVNMMSQYNILSIEIKTRAEDWKAGQLSDEYVNKKFLQAEAKLKEYERTAVPPGWSCDWNSQYSRYFYRNDITGDAQWNYPQEAATQPPTPATASTVVAVATAPVTPPPPPPAPTVTATSINVDGKLQATQSSSASKETTTTKSVTTTAAASCGGQQINNTTTTAPTTTTVVVGGTTVASTPSTTATDAYTTTNQYQQQQQQQHYWMYNVAYPYNNGYTTTDSIPPPPGEEATQQPPLPPSDLPPPPLPPPDSPLPPPLPPTEPPKEEAVDEEMDMCSDAEMDDKSVITLSSDSDDGSVAASISSKPVPAVEIVSGAVDYSSVPVRFPVTFPSAVAAFQAAALPITAAAATSGIIQQQLSNDSDGNNNNQKDKTTKKIKKVKKLAKKPPKQVSGMISKWQKAQTEIDEEKKKFMREAEEEFEEESNVGKRIEKWKKKQLESGKTVGNSNFEPVGDLWKQRAKKRM